MITDIIHIHLGLLHHQHMHERMGHTGVSTNGDLNAVLDELSSIVLAFVTKRVALGGGNICPAHPGQVTVKWASKAYSSCSNFGPFGIGLWIIE